MDILAVRGIDKVTDSFLIKLIQIAERLGTNPDFLATAIAFETGGTWSPTVKNAMGSGAIGLIQFMPNTARNLGTSIDKLSKMSGYDQLDYVEKYLSWYKNRIGTLQDLYMSILYPAYIGKKPEDILFKKDSKAYQQNRGFDADNKGYVAVADVTHRIMAVYKDGLSRTRRVIL